MFILAFVDKGTEPGGTYLTGKKDDSYYRNARFYSAAEAKQVLTQARFEVTGERQTVFNFDDEPQDVVPGTGAGAFTVLRAEKTIAIDRMIHRPEK